MEGTKIARRLAQIVVWLNILAIVAGLALEIGLSTFSFSFWTVNAVVYTILANLIIGRRPGHIVGWLFLIVSFFLSQGVLGGGLLALFGQFEDSSLQVGPLAWASQLFFIPSLMIPVTLVLQYFPDGRLPSRRWWPLPAVSVAAMLGFASYFMFAPWTLEEEGLAISNPLAIAGGERVLDTVINAAGPALVVGIVGSLLILLVRYRRSDALERAQMKWLFYVATIALPILLFSEELFGAAGETVSFHLFAAMPSILALPMGAAILRYRLFDIDIIIRRTLQYGLVTGLLALVYFGLVVGLQRLFAAVGDIQSEVYIVISTLAIAGLFNPVRGRVQEAVDRRFYRGKYDAEQALARFAAVARDEVDLDKLALALLEVVEETLQPERASLSLARIE